MSSILDVVMLRPNRQAWSDGSRMVDASQKLEGFADKPSLAAFANHQLCSIKHGCDARSMPIGPLTTVTKTKNTSVHVSSNFHNIEFKHAMPPPSGPK